MFENFESDEFASLLEAYESDESDEAYESDELFESDERAVRRRRPVPRPPLRTARRGNPVATRPPSGVATKAELAATAKRLDDRIGVNSAAIKAADVRLRRTEAETSSIGAALRKEVTERKAATDALKKGLDESRQLGMLLPLLSPSKTEEVTTTSGQKVKALVDSGDKFSKILPMLLMSGGLGGSGAGGAGGGDNNMLMMIALISALD
jgi:hypothetical protein